ncbi:MAG: Phosphate transport ATP-binding protein PstB, partial [uncultured Thermomicrobiales bacterium]
EYERTARARDGDHRDGANGDRRRARHGPRQRQPGRDGPGRAGKSPGPRGDRAEGRGGRLARRGRGQCLVRQHPRDQRCVDDLPRQRGDRADRPLRLRQVDLPALPQPDARGPGGRARRGQDPDRRPGHLWQGCRFGARAPPHRDGLPEAESVPDDVDLRQRDRRAEAERHPQAQVGDGRDGRAQPARRGPLERGQGQAQRVGRIPLRWSAAAPLHRPHDRGRAGGRADGRAVLGPRPDLDLQDRGTDRRTEAEVHDRDRHPQHAASLARRRLDLLHARGRRRLRATGRVRAHRADLHPAAGQAHRGLHHRALRL